MISFVRTPAVGARHDWIVTFGMVPGRLGSDAGGKEMGGLAPPAVVAPPRPFVLSDLLALAADPALRWDPLAPGVEIHRLYQWPTGQSAALLRYAPGAHIPQHRHVGTEQILVLSGSQADDVGRHGPGALVVHPAGTSHAIGSDEGCLVLAIWEQPVVFVV